jgi:hypothetical protein
MDILYGYKSHTQRDKQIYLTLKLKNVTELVASGHTFSWHLAWSLAKLPPIQKGFHNFPISPHEWLKLYVEIEADSLLVLISHGLWMDTT